MAPPRPDQGWSRERQYFWEKGNAVISAVVMTEPFRPLEMRSFERPELEPGAVLLRQHRR